MHFQYFRLLGRCSRHWIPEFSGMTGVSCSCFVTPAQAGVQGVVRLLLDSGIRRNDGVSCSCFVTPAQAGVQGVVR